MWNEWNPTRLLESTLYHVDAELDLTSLPHVHLIHGLLHGEEGVGIVSGGAVSGDFAPACC